MDSVSLMDRTETKFIFNVKQFTSILKELESEYNILEIEGNRMSSYKNLYFDTPEFDLYSKHHNGKLNRYKVRYRKYVESNWFFLEVKFKNNRGRMIKTRIKESSVSEINTGKGFDFLNQTLPFSPLTLVPKIWINYTRITLVNKLINEKLTFDINLEFEKDEQKQLLDWLVIAEVKQECKIASPFITLMRKKHIREESISKYCFGTALNFAEVKKNNFKQNISNVYKLQK